VELNLSFGSMNRRTFLLLVSLPLTSAFGGEQLPETEGRLSLVRVTQTVLADNPSLKAARAKWEMMRARVPQAAAWDDPMAGVDFERFGTTRFDTYTGAEYMLSQRIPIAGKNRSRARAAQAEALATLAELRRKELDLVMRTRAAFFQLANAAAQLEVNRRDKSLLEQFAEISRANYEVGTQTTTDVLTAETDLLRLSEDEMNLAREFSDAQTQLNVLMNRPARTPVGQPSELAVAAPRFSTAQLDQLALANRPELLQAAQRITAESEKLQVARREVIPEPTIRVEARHFKGSDRAVQEYDTGVFFEVPWVNWGKYRAQQREAQSNVEMSRRELEAAETETLGLLRDQLRKVQTLQHHVALYRDRLVPTARRTVEATRIGYEADKNTFLELISGQRSLREIEAAYHRHVAGYRTSLAELEALVGVDLGIFPRAARASK
jgi:outer membrane protein, heavy metal efflux system